MLRTLILGALLALVTSRANARLWETIPQIEARYGHALETSPGDAPGEEDRKYRYKDFYVLVTFLYGRSDVEWYFHTDGYGYCHFPQLENGEPIRGYDEEYFKGLKAERRIIRHKHGFRTYEWVKLPSQRNEPFDCRILALAALVMPSSGINLDTMRRDVFENQAAEADLASSPFGARRMGGTENLPIEDFRVRRSIRLHVIGESPPSPWGALW